MSQEREALKKTLISAGLFVGSILGAIGSVVGLTLLFDSLGFTPGAAYNLAFVIVFLTGGGGVILRMLYKENLEAIRRRDEQIMKGLRG